MPSRTSPHPEERPGDSRARLEGRKHADAARKDERIVAWALHRRVIG